MLNVGVLEPGFHLPRFEFIELWRPLHVLPRDEQNREREKTGLHSRLGGHERIVSRTMTRAQAPTRAAGVDS